MSVRDRVVSVLTATAIGAAFAGGWLLFSLGAALLIAAVPLFVVALLVAIATPDVVEASETNVEPMRGEAPKTTTTVLRSPFPIAER